MATNIVNLQAVKAQLLQSLADETLFQERYGPRPSYNLDGEGYQWVEWRRAILDKIKSLNALIQLEDGPFEIRSRGYTL